MKALPMTPVSTERVKEIKLMAVEICLYRGENPNSVDRGGVEGWEKHKPLAHVVLDYAEHLLSLRASPADGELVERLSAKAADEIADAVMGNEHLDHCLDAQQRDEVRSDIQIEAVRVVSTLLSTQGKRLAELEEKVRLAEAAENEAKDCFWAVYPAYLDKHGHGISVEAARTEIVDRAINAESALSTAEARALERAAKIAEDEPQMFFDDALGRDLAAVRKTHAATIAAAIRALSTNEAGK